MISRFFHQWERRLASIDNNRVVRPFEWGLEWLGPVGSTRERSGFDDVDVDDAYEILSAWADATVESSEAFYALAPCDDYQLRGERLTFPSAVVTPHEGNNTVHARWLPNASPRGRRRAVVVLPQWNSDPQGHVGLCRLLNRVGLSALRLSLPYHDARMPPELERADYIVSANIGRTAQVCRQAVLDARRAAWWLRDQGYESIGILGTSLGSCLAMLTAAHEPLIRAVALNHISPYFADVIWDGLSTRHVRQGLDGGIDLEQLRRVWMPISPYPYLDRMQGKRVLLVYARYDLSFPVPLSQQLVEEFRRRGLAPEVAVLPCGHYSTGKGVFKWMDGLTLCRFLTRNL